MPTGEDRELSLIPCDPVRHGEMIREETSKNFEALMRRRGVWDEARHNREPEPPDAYRMIVREHRIVGFMAVRTASDHLYLRTIQVLGTDREHGVGAWAMRQVESMAIDQRVSAIRLRVFLDNPARRWYARLGFQPISSDDDSALLEKPVIAPPAGRRSESE